jgi:hypothetical protein
MANTLTTQTKANYMTRLRKLIRYRDAGIIKDEKEVALLLGEIERLGAKLGVDVTNPEEVFAKPGRPRIRPDIAEELQKEFDALGKGDNYYSKEKVEARRNAILQKGSDDIEAMQAIVEAERKKKGDLPLVGDSKTEL